MKVLVLNCGSSSVKYKLFDMQQKSVIAQGGVEKVGLSGAFIKFTLPDGQKVVVEKEIPGHYAAIELILSILTSFLLVFGSESGVGFSVGGSFSISSSSSSSPHAVMVKLKRTTKSPALINLNVFMF